MKFNTKKQGGDLSVKTFFFKIPESRNFRKPHLDNNTSAIFQSNREETIIFFLNERLYIQFNTETKIIFILKPLNKELLLGFSRNLLFVNDSF